MLEYPDADVRRQRLAELRGIEEKTYVQVEGFGPVWPVANEDLERTNDDKTSSVHFMRFELAPGMIAAVKGGKRRCDGHRASGLQPPRRCRTGAGTGGPGSGPRLGAAVRRRRLPDAPPRVTLPGGGCPTARKPAPMGPGNGG